MLATGLLSTPSTVTVMGPWEGRQPSQLHQTLDQSMHISGTHGGPTARYDTAACKWSVEASAGHAVIIHNRSTHRAQFASCINVSDRLEWRFGGGICLLNGQILVGLGACSNRVGNFFPLKGPEALASGAAGSMLPIDTMRQ